MILNMCLLQSKRLVKYRFKLKFPARISSGIQGNLGVEEGWTEKEGQEITQISN
jgi:hypothetical protein